MTTRESLRSPAVLALVLAAAPVPAQGSDWTALVEAGRNLEVVEGELRGPARTWLLDEARASQFFLIGELHGIADISHFATALYRDPEPPRLRPPSRSRPRRRRPAY